MKNSKKIIICIFIIVVVFSLLFFYATRYNLKYKIESYSITALTDDLLAWTKYEFDCNEATVIDITENPSKYYLVVLDGEMFNNHFYSLYNWYALEQKALSDTTDYWIDTSHIEGTYAFKPFSEHSHSVAVLVKCGENEIKDFCENILLKQPLSCRGEIIINKLPVT